MLTNLADYRRQKNIDAVLVRLKHCSAKLLFTAAYFQHYGCLDKYEMQANLDQWDRRAYVVDYDVPDYVIAYMKMQH